MTKAKGAALHVGLDSVDPAAYGGWAGRLLACVADAKDMRAIAEHAGFSARTLLDVQATRAAVLRGVASAAKRLRAGDLFLLTYSGHGGQLPDLNSDEDDGQDETWCLHDGQLVDDQVYDALAGFRAGVRVLMLSDSCHSGTVAKAAFHGLGGAATLARGDASAAYRSMPPELSTSAYLAKKAAYDRVLRSPTLASAKERVRASVLLISGCQDNQLSQDGRYNGLFTGTLKSVWNGGRFSGDHTAFWKAIARRMPPTQTPNLYAVGASDPKFLAATPFTI